MATTTNASLPEYSGLSGAIGSQWLLGINYLQLRAWCLAIHIP